MIEFFLIIFIYFHIIYAVNLDIPSFLSLNRINVKKKIKGLAPPPHIPKNDLNRKYKFQEIHEDLLNKLKTNSHTNMWVWSQVGINIVQQIMSLI